MFAKSLGRALAILTVVPSAAFALGLGDLRLLSPLNAPLDAEIELVDVTPEEMQSLKAQIASRDTFARYGLDWPVFMSSIQVRTSRTSDGREVIKLKSTDTITEPFITLLVEVNYARGRLVREYTMLLDPPVYTPGQAAAASPPVAAPSAGAGSHEGAISRGNEPGTAPGAPATPPASAASSPSAQSAASPKSSHTAPASAAASTASSDATPGSSHVVKRGETLSAIAAAAAGSSANTAQTRSWMLAIYQANPGAFEKNMNVLRSGAVLRLPDNSAVTSISPTEANGEIRRQYAAWRSNGPAAAPASNEQGRLRLVTPNESGSVGTAGNSADNQALQGKIKDLEGQLSESKRLLELRNAELGRLQAQLAKKAAPTPEPTPASAPTPAPAPPVAATPPPAATPPAPVEKAPPAQAEAPTPPPAVEPAPSAQPTPSAAEQTRTHRPRPAPAEKPAAPEGGSILDTLKEYWWALAVLVAAVLALLGLRAWRSRRQSEFDDSLGRLAVAGNHADPELGLGDTATVRPLGAPKEDSFLVEETGTHERLRSAPPTSAPRHVSNDETISSETAINLDQGDPLAEADFHMAYGLYDQAADLIRIAISREPTRRDLKLKLLEVFFVWGNKEQFLHSARELAETRDEAAPGEWEKIVIMGKQLAPEDPLFAGGGAVSGAAAGGIDLDLEGGENRVDFDLLGEPVPGQTGNNQVDLDIGSALGAAEAGSDTHTGNTDRNFGLDEAFEGVASRTGTTRQMTQRITRDDVSEYGAETTEAPTVEQPTINSPENPTIRQKVAMALRQGNPAEQTAELALDDLGLDLGALDTVDQPGLAASSDAPTMVAGFDEHSRKVIADAERRAGGEEHDPGSTVAFRMDESDLNTILGRPNGHTSDVSGFDPSETSRLPPLSSKDLDFDLGDGEFDADGSHQHAANGGGVDLDVGTATAPDTAFTATQRLQSDDLALPDLEPVTMSEVGTKLDLARAYMDMGDPEGARNILEEVLHEGSVAQKQEAQRLIESLPG